jgi:hypothetical protein
MVHSPGKNPGSSSSLWYADLGVEFCAVGGGDRRRAIIIRCPYNVVVRRRGPAADGFATTTAQAAVHRATAVIGP